MNNFLNSPLELGMTIFGLVLLVGVAVAKWRDNEESRDLCKSEDEHKIA